MEKKFFIKVTGSHIHDIDRISDKDLIGPYDDENSARAVADYILATGYQDQGETWDNLEVIIVVGFVDTDGTYYLPARVKSPKKIDLPEKK